MISHMPALLLRCLLCTVIIECAAAFILGLRKPDEQLTVALVNVVTNPLLVSICILVQLFYSFFGHKTTLSEGFYSRVKTYSIMSYTVLTCGCKMFD